MRRQPEQKEIILYSIPIIDTFLERCQNSGIPPADNMMPATARRYYIPDQKIWSCRLKLPPDHRQFTTRFSSPAINQVSSSNTTLMMMASITDTEESLNDAHQHDQTTAEVMSMADKLQSRMDNDMDAHQDPDAQATVTDFLDFTEYLPSDMTRSLTLIGNLDETYTKASKNVHGLTKVYGELPARPASERPDAIKLRSDISQNLSEAVTARTLSYEEACRLKENVDRHYNRLKNIHAKLQKMAENYPPCRPASPEPQPSKSPQVARTLPKITLRLDGSKAGERARRHPQARITVPGEVMAPFEVDYDSYGSYSETESSGGEEGPSRVQTPGLPTNKPKSIKLNVVPKPLKEKVLKASRPPRADGSLGTNVHSQVAGISTSNALAKLKPPAPDTKPGDPDAPWLKLTAWELAKLRKKMKKNAVWSPSDTMIARELKSKGRSLDYYNKHNIERQAAGLAPLDIFPQMMNSAQASTVLAEGEISAEAWKKELSNRGMKLNEAKRLKKEIEKKAALELGKIANANEFAAAQGLAVVNDVPLSKDTLVNGPSAKDSSSTDVAGEGISAKDNPLKDALAKPTTFKTTAGKNKLSKKAATKEAKDLKNGFKEAKVLKNDVKEDGHSETPTEHKVLLNSLEGIREKLKIAANSGLTVSIVEKPADGGSGTPKKQSAKTGKKRKTRDSTADTETSKASKASKVEGPGGSLLRIERRSVTETPVPNPPPPPSSSTTTTIIPLAPPGPTSSRSNPRRGTPVTAVAPVIEPAVSSDRTPASIVPADIVPTIAEDMGIVDSKAQPAMEPEENMVKEAAQETVPEAVQEPEPVVQKEVTKQPHRKKVTQLEKRARAKLAKAAKEAKKEAQLEAQREAENEAQKEVQKEAPKPVTTVPGSRNRRKASIATAAPLPETQSLPPRRTASRPASRNGKAPSYEPQIPTAKERPRRSSTAHNTPAPEPRAPSKRLEAKRPPPGHVTAGPEGSASVSVSKRKAAPRKRAAPKKQKEEGKEPEPIVEDMVELDDEGNIIDESEPRYCTCNKVSFGNMIACDSEKILGRDCPFGEWFHYECVGYSETNMPPRRDSWYCEGCIKEMAAQKPQTEKGGNKRK